MTSIATRAKEMIDEVDARPARRQVCIMNGPMVWAAPHTSEGQRRFIVVTGTVVLDGGTTGPVPDGTQPPVQHAPYRSPVARRQEVFEELAGRR